MEQKENMLFWSSVCKIAVPVTLQSVLQSSFSFVDQIMIGQLGSAGVAGVGLAGKFSSIFSVVAAAVGTVAGILMSQYIGAEDEEEAKRSFVINLLVAGGIALAFLLLCLSFPRKIMGIYSKDMEVITSAAEYLTIVSASFLPAAGATLISAWFRCKERAQIPLYASLAAVACNTVLNYIFIFGCLGFGPMGIKGAAWATVISQWLHVLLMLTALHRRKEGPFLRLSVFHGKMGWRQYIVILLPILVNEFLWSLGENIYATVYGHLGTESLAAMTLTNPIQGLMIGALSGLAGATGILIGKQLGRGDYERAYLDSKRLIKAGLVGALCLSCILLAVKGLYVDIYQVEDSVKSITEQILIAYAAVAPVKVLNMILGGGIIRSGGETKLVMYIDLIGTWIFGIPLALISAFVLRLSIPWVYFILSLEEAVRLIISLAVFRRRGWMRKL